MAPLFFDDFNEGDEFITPRRTIAESDVLGFAGLSGDFNALHTDNVFAAETPFGQVVAHGLLIVGIATGLLARLGIFEGSALAMLGIEDWRFLKPVFIGDTIHVRMTILAKRATSHPGRGILRRRFEVVNQRAEVVQEGVINLMCKRRVTDATTAGAG